MRTNAHHRCYALQRSVLFVVLIAVGCSTSGSASPAGGKDIDQFVSGIPDPKMKERWVQADAEGKLPPLDAVEAPAPGQALTAHRPGNIEAAPQPNYRPSLPDGEVASAEVWSSVPVQEYRGPFLLLGAAPDLLAGRLDGKQKDATFEVHFRLPGNTEQVAVEKGTNLQLNYRDRVMDGALQRRIVLHDGKGRVPLLYLAEGSSNPYRTEIKSLGLTITQQGQEPGATPAVTVTRSRGETVTLLPGEQEILGKAENPLRVHLLESIARSPQQAMLTEGQPYYVRLMIHSAR